jgi:hypothetical protein
MAENDNSGAPAPLEDAGATIPALLFECRLTVEATVAGLQSLAPKAPEPIKSELAVLVLFAQQAAKAFEALASRVTDILPLSFGGQA